MPIPYRDADDLDELGTAGYLKIDPLANSQGYMGALFLINARGEPVEFTYNRIDTPQTFLWRQEDLRRHAIKKLVASLFSLCPRTPRLLLCLAEEVASELFSQDIEVSLSVCRIAPTLTPVLPSPTETKDTLQAPEPVQVFWFPGRPAEDSMEWQLLQRLAAHGLLLEPFERASFGLREVYRTEGAENKR
ncbi:MAG: hypothetical protein AB7G75_01615 [Candidatus Binatia bacterium]